MIYSLDDKKIHQPFDKYPNFTPWEFRCRDRENKSFKGPYAEQIKVDLRLVERLQKARKLIGKPITITSAYRTPSYNDHIVGAKSSRHILGHAADVSVKDIAGEVLAHFMYMSGFRRVGLAQTWCHVDVGPGEAYWSYHPLTQSNVDSWKKQINIMHKGHSR